MAKYREMLAEMRLGNVVVRGGGLRVKTQVMSHGMMPGNTYQEDFQRLVYQSLA